jgi:hypothetical protein
MDMSTTESSLMTATRVDKSAEVTSTTETLIGKSTKETRIVTGTPMEMSVFETRWREHKSADTAAIGLNTASANLKTVSASSGIMILPINLNVEIPPRQMKGNDPHVDTIEATSTSFTTLVSFVVRPDLRHIVPCIIENAGVFELSATSCAR